MEGIEEEEAKLGSIEKSYDEVFDLFLRRKSLPGMVETPDRA